VWEYFDALLLLSDKKQRSEHKMKHVIGDVRGLTFLALCLLVILPSQRAYAQQYQVLYSFHGAADGGTPYAGVIRDRAGNLYSTTYYGGAFGHGAVFKLDRANNETVLYSFKGAPSDGSNPYAPLTRDTAGNFYGNTYIGGQDDLGTIFKLDSAGNETILHDFAGIAGRPPDGGAPFAKLLRDQEGNLYSTTLEGGSRGWGTVFKLDPTGRLTFLHEFSGDDGGQPITGLIHDNAGNFYGTAEYGGRFDLGVVYQIAPTGDYTILHSFNDRDGSLPYGGVVRDGAGNLYGTTLIGGAFQQG
jgi:uncharacterized repeat protein (TIGR03803 family)